MSNPAATPLPNHGSRGVTADLDQLIALRHEARTLRLDFSRGIRSVLAGPHRSRFRGRGMDYAESRHYEPGDDVRSIDWRVTARTGKPHTKLFTEERERPVFLLMDFSSGMYFGTRETLKTVLAARAAALVTWTASLAGDRVGGVLVNDAGLSDLKPRSGRRGALMMINALATATHALPEEWKEPLLNTGLEHLSAVVHPGSLVFLFSDFYGLDKTTHKLVSTLSQHNDIVACHVCDPLEIQPPKSGRYRISDGSSSGNFALIDSASRTGRHVYRHRVIEEVDAVASKLRKFGIPVIRFCNGNNPAKTLNRYFGTAPLTGSQTD